MFNDIVRSKHDSGRHASNQPTAGSIEAPARHSQKHEHALDGASTSARSFAQAEHLVTIQPTQAKLTAALARLQVVCILPQLLWCAVHCQKQVCLVHNTSLNSNVYTHNHDTLSFCVQVPEQDALSTINHGMRLHVQ
jgi:hypothetical protein